MVSRILDPRTATKKISIWWPLGEVQFQQNISTLWRATRGRPKDPQTYPVAMQGIHDDDVLPIALELQLANGIAFIAAAKKGVEFVSAAAIEIPWNPSDGLRLNLAANEEISQIVKDRLDEVIATVRHVARGDKTTLQCKDDILTLLVQLHRPRINARLQTKKSRHLVQDGLENILLSLIKSSKSSRHSILITRLETLRDALRQYCNQIEKYRTIEDVKRVVVACYDFFGLQPKGESMKNMLGRGGVDTDESRGNPHLRQVGKIATLCHIAEMLSLMASHRSFRCLCVNISIQYLPAYSTIQSPIPAVDGGSRECRVHAEVQLVVEFDVRETLGWNRPRVIGSSKAPCYLCELFIDQHRQYFVPRTHGKLTPRWTIPDLHQFSRRHVSQYRSIIKAMDCELQKPVAMPHTGRLDPAMSWQALSQLNLALFQPIAASHINLTLPNVQAVSPSPEAPLAPDEGQPSATLSLPDLGGGDEPQQLVRKPTSEAMTLPTRYQTPESTAMHMNPRRLSDNTLPVGNAISYSSSSLQSCRKERHSPEQQHLEQARSSMSVGFKQSTRAARIIRDHESRACDMLFEYSMNEQVSMQHSNSMSRRIDFHDIELFLEIEHPTTAQMVIMRCSRPEHPESHPVIEVDKLKPGVALEIDTGGISSEYRMLFLTKTDTMGINQWWACIWKKQH